MRKLLIPLISLALISSCGKEMNMPPVSAQVSVNLEIPPLEGDAETKSSMPSSADTAFTGAALFAFDHFTGRIKLDSNGIPYTQTVNTRSFTWTLPKNELLDLYAIINYEGNIDGIADLLSDTSLTVGDLMALNFSCTSVSGLASIPMSAVKECVVLTDAGGAIDLPAKRVMAKYIFYFDLTELLAEGYTVTAASLSACRSNTVVPLFGDWYAQADPSLLATLDATTAADESALTDGFAVPLYFLENCQGDKFGADHWSQVASSGLPGLDLCSYIQVSVTLSRDGVQSQADYQVFLGSDCTTNFDVVRNVCQTLRMTLHTPAAPTISWDAEPAYICQRGAIGVTGLPDGGSITNAVSSDASVARISAISGSQVYVEAIGTGSADITVSTTHGSGTVSLTAAGLYARANRSTLYVNPDGGLAGSDPYGLSYAPVSWTYCSSAGDQSGFSLIQPASPSTSPVCGGSLDQGLVNECLHPAMSVSGAGSAYLTADGSIYASSIPSSCDASWTAAKTVTLGGTHIIGSSAITVYGANPYDAWTGSSNVSDEDDYSLVSAYVTHSYVTHTYPYRTIHASLGHFANPHAEGPAATSGVVSALSATLGFYTLSASALSDHIGGTVRLGNYIENRHSHQRWADTYGSFDIYVHGAIGATLSGVGTSQVDIGTAFCSSEASYGFGTVAGCSDFIRVGYNNGDIFGPTGATVANIPADGCVGLNQRAYSLVGGSIASFSARQIKEMESPRFTFQSNGPGIFHGDYLYGGYYVINDYYILHLLQDIDRLTLGPNAGWIN